MEPETLEIRTGDLDIEFDFAGSATRPTCELKVGGKKCSKCRLCTNTNGHVGVRAECPNDDSSSTAAHFADNDCVPLSKMASDRFLA